MIEDFDQKKFEEERRLRLKYFGQKPPKKDEDDDEDDDQNFIKKDDPEAQIDGAESDVIDDLKKIKNNIKPTSNQQRNLDREVGGLEEEEQKESSEKDVWDDRSEEVDKMGSINVFKSTGMKSVVWKQKQNRLKSKKLHDLGADAAMVKSVKNNQGAGASNFDDMGYVQKLKHLRQDRSHEGNNSREI